MSVSCQSRPRPEGTVFTLQGAPQCGAVLQGNLRLVWRPALAAGSGSDLEGAIRHGGRRWRRCRSLHESWSTPTRRGGNCQNSAARIGSS